MGYYVPAIKQFVGLADSNTCTPATAARAWRDKICLCFLASNRSQAGMFEKHQQSLQTLPSSIHGAQSLLGVNQCCAGDGRRKVWCTFWSPGRRQTCQPDVSVWGHFSSWNLGLGGLSCLYKHGMAGWPFSWFSSMNMISAPLTESGAISVSRHIFPPEKNRCCYWKKKSCLWNI